MVHRAMIKTLLDAAVATETRTQQERIKRLEEMYEKEIGENDKFIGTNLQALLTRELNSANQIIRQQQLLEEENLRLQDRIKRLVKVGDYLDAYVSPVRENRTVKQLWTQAKEAKP
jgi:hypothetical protein